MKHPFLLIGAVLIILCTPQNAEALRYPPGFNGGGYVAANLLGPTDVQSGDDFTYTIILTNDGSGYARNVQVTYAIPDGIRWRDRFSHSTCKQYINEIICTYDLVQPGSQSIPLNFTTDRLIQTNSAFCPRTITSSARVSAGSSDTFAGDNISPALSTRISCYDPPNRSYRQGVDLQINLTAPQTIITGDTVTLSAIVTNAGTDNAAFVTMLMSLPSGLTVQDIPRFCQISGSMITCTNFTLRSGESRVLTFIMPIASAFSCPASLEWRAQVYSGSQNSYGVYRTNTARTSVACQPTTTIPLPQSSHLPLGGNNTTDKKNNGGNSGGYPGFGSSGGSGGQGWATYNGSYRDPLHVCDLPLDVIFPCPIKDSRSTGGGSTGGAGGGTSGGTGGGTGGGIGGSGGGTTGGGTGGTTGGGGFFGGGTGGGTSGDGGGDDDKSQKESTDKTSTAAKILPPDRSGNWVWDGNGWIYSTLASAKPMIDLDRWTLQFCTGSERGTITYEIEISNRFEAAMQDIDVVEMLNPTAVCIKNAQGGLIGPRHILWQIDALTPLTTHTMQYTVGILSHVPDQFVIANLTHAGTSGPHILTRDFHMLEVSRQIK